MCAAERYSPNINAAIYKPTFEKPARTLSDAGEFLASESHLELLAYFYRSFYIEYCGDEYIDPDTNTRFDEILSLGEIKNSVIIARHDNTRHPNEPDSYFIKQYDLATKKISTWNVADTRPELCTGRGDSFERTLILEDEKDCFYTAKLTLSNSGNEWHSPNEAGKLRSALLLPYQAMYDQGCTEKDLQILYEEMLRQEADARDVQARRFGASALTIPSPLGIVNT